MSSLSAEKFSQTLKDLVKGKIDLGSLGLGFAQDNLQSAFGVQPSVVSIYLLHHPVFDGLSFREYCIQKLGGAKALAIMRPVSEAVACLLPFCGSQNFSLNRIQKHEAAEPCNW